MTDSFRGGEGGLGVRGRGEGRRGREGCWGKAVPEKDLAGK